jgi:hypothetical protein
MKTRDYMQERWFQVLVEAVEADPRGRAGVAERLGKRCGRSALSLVLSGEYPAEPGAVARRVLEVYDRVDCPYFGTQVKVGFCQSASAGPVPIWDPAALELRRCCQTCEHRPAAAMTPIEEEKA